MAIKNIPIGQILLQEQLITQDQLEQALVIQKEKGARLGDVLIDEGFVSEIEFTKALAKRLKITYVNLDDTVIKEKAARLITRGIAEKYNAIPVDIQGNHLIVAMSDPMNFFAAEDIKLLTGMEVEQVIASKGQIEDAIENIYAKQFAYEAAEDVSKEFEIVTQSDIQSIENDMESRVDSAPVVRLVNSIMLQAAAIGASDIHIEPSKTNTRIRMRVDGKLQEIMTLSIAAHSSIVTRLKIMGSMNIAERRLPLDGRCETEVNGMQLDMRISTLPTVYGEKVVVRLLASSLSKGIINKEDIGFTAHNMAMFDDLIRTSHGIILVTGPTGSGKTTTLYAIVKEILNAQINIVTVEDPVEYKIEGASQMQINTKAGLTFATGLRSILRQDPDVIMIGEIRDNETAEISIRAAITGHLVLSTLHTNDAITTINRLVDMDVKPYLVSASLAGIIAQRLVRLICPKCNKEYTSNETENTALGISDSVTLHKGTGCPFCNYTGYKGRKAVHEIVIVDDAMRSMITKEVPSSVMYEYVKDKGTTTLKQNVIELVLAGETTVEELIEVTYSL